MKSANKFLCVLFVLAFITSLCAGITSCTGNSGESTSRIGVIVTIPPQAQFVRKVGGQMVDVTIMVPPGAEPHSYDPSPSQMRSVAEAQFYVKVGTALEFEIAWLDKLLEQNSDLVVVDCSEGVHLIEMTAEPEHNDVSYEYDTGNSENNPDPHIWMSPVNARIMVENICNGLTGVDPENEEYYEANRDIYLQKLTDLDLDIRGTLSAVLNRMFMTYHPSFGYFAAEYGFTMMAIEEEGKEPTASGITRLVEQAKQHQVEVIFASPQFNPRSAEVIAEEIGGTVIFIDALAEDYTGNLRIFLDQLVQALE